MTPDVRGTYLWWHERRARFIASRPTAPGPHVAEMEPGLRQILETGLHAAFNVGLRGIADTQEIRPGAAALAATGLAPADPVGEAAARGLQRPTPRRRAG